MPPNTEALRTARKNAGLTQKQLAARIGVSVDTIGRAERGDHLTLVTTLARIARETGVSLDTLVRLDP
jgi:transcriptional regulator with XRE-family HTH domain